MKKLSKEELEQIAEIEKKSFSISWDFEELCSMNEDENYTFFICKTDDNIRTIGYILVLEVEEVYEIIRLGVAPEYRNRGFAKHLMEMAIAETQRKNACVILLEVRESNLAARTLYEKYGFKNIAIRKKYYSDNGENAIVMKKELKEQTEIIL